jgi:hypothetical protein
MAKNNVCFVREGLFSQRAGMHGSSNDVITHWAKSGVSEKP